MRTADKVSKDCAAFSGKATCPDACEWADYEQGARDATRSRDAELAKELRRIAIDGGMSRMSIHKDDYDKLVAELEGKVKP